MLTWLTLKAEKRPPKAGGSEGALVAAQVESPNCAMAGIATREEQLRPKTTKRLKSAAVVITPILFYLAVVGIAVKLVFIAVFLIYLYFLIFHTAGTLTMTGGALLMGLLKRVPDSVTATVLVIAAIYFFIRWMRSGNGTDLPIAPSGDDQLRIEALPVEADERERHL